MEISKNNDYIREIQSKRIRECIKKCGMTQKYVAQKLGYTEQHLSNVLNCKRNLSTEMAMKMADLFSEYMDPVTFQFDVPFESLNPSEQEKYRDNTDKYGNVAISGTFPRVDYKYLLGDVEYETPSKIEQPKEETPDYLFKKGIVSLLHQYGYDIDIGYCPDLIFCKEPLPGDPFIQVCSLFRDQKTKITEIETGNTLEIPPGESFQLFQDFSSAVIGIVKREFERQQWLSIANSAPLNGK